MRPQQSQLSEKVMWLKKIGLVVLDFQKCFRHFCQCFCLGLYRLTLAYVIQSVDSHWRHGVECNLTNQI